MTPLVQSLQDDVLVLLTYQTSEALLIRNMIPLSCFEGLYHTLAKKIYDYLDTYHQAPCEHLGDLLETEFLDRRAGRGYQALVIQIAVAKDNINIKFVLDRLQRFVSFQSLKIGIIRASEALQTNAAGSVEEAEAILQEATKNRLKAFSPGLSGVSTDLLQCYDTLDAEAFPTGIDLFDRQDLGPARKELHLFVSLSNRGKTWWLTSLGKHAIRHRFRVCHVTLEMSEERVAQRYLQSLFAVGRTMTPSIIQRFEKTYRGDFEALDEKTVYPSLSLDEENFRTNLHAKIARWGPRMADKLIIKSFPTGSLTTRQLEGYLDALDTQHNFRPDLLLVDYIDLMHIDSDNYRLGLGNTYKRLRGLAVERNLALATVTQSNREGVGARQVTEAHISEDYSKFMTADVVLTYSQTPKEKEMSLARVCASKVRNNQAGWTVIVSQNYALGQFCVDAVPLSSSYHSTIGNTKH